MLLAVVLALALVGGAAAKTRLTVYLTHDQAVSIVKSLGGSVHSCKRRAPRHFTCRATFWKIRHEGEEVEPGVVVETSSEAIPEERTVEVWIGR